MTKFYLKTQLVKILTKTSRKNKFGIEQLDSVHARKISLRGKIIILTIYQALASFGGDTELVKHFENCKTLTVEVTGTEIISDGEYFDTDYLCTDKIGTRPS